MDRISQITSPDLFTSLCQHLFVEEYYDFQAIDDSGGDAGNDGYSAKQGTLFQLYCPEKPNKINDAKYKIKIKNDLDKAKILTESKNKQYNIKKWIFVTPSKLSEDVQTYIRIESKKRGFEGMS